MRVRWWLSMTMVLGSCSGSASTKYQKSLECYQTSVTYGALRTAMTQFGITENDGSDSSDLPRRWSNKALFDGAKAGESQDKIANDLKARLSASMDSMRKMSALRGDKIKNAILKNNRDAQGCIALL